MNEALTTAVIGTGKISDEHLKFLRRTDSVTIGGLCDLSPALAKYATSKCASARPYSDYRQMLLELRPNVVHILTPAISHLQLVRDCLASGAHVICEKPITPSSNELELLLKDSATYDRRIVEDHNYRFNRPILAIEEAVERGDLGQIVEVDVRMCLNLHQGRYADRNLPHSSHKMPAGVIHEFLTHLVYIAQRFVPNFDSVRACWRNLRGDDLFKYDDLDALVISGEARARIRFTSQCRPDCFTIVVRGTRGWAETDLFQPYLRFVIPRRGGALLSPLVNHWANGFGFVGSSISGFWRKVMQRTPYEGLHEFLRRTYAALAAGTEPPVTEIDMRRASRLIDALLDEENRF